MLDRPRSESRQFVEFGDEEVHQLSTGEGLAFVGLFGSTAAIAIGVSVWWAIGAFVVFAVVLAIVSETGRREERRDGRLP